MAGSIFGFFQNASSPHKTLLPHQTKSAKMPPFVYNGGILSYNAPLRFASAEKTDRTNASLRFASA